MTTVDLLKAAGFVRCSLTAPPSTLPRAQGERPIIGALHDTQFVDLSIGTTPMWIDEEPVDESSQT